MLNNFYPITINPMLQSNINSFIKRRSCHEFSSGGETGSDYKEFQSDYKAILKRICVELQSHGTHVQIESFSPNHYCFTCVLKLETPDGFNKFIYVSVGDVRDSQERHNNILFRSMQHAEDWTWWPNRYCKLDDLAGSIQNLYRY